ncbi:WSC domain-containing protein [Xylogone sp. PMI_703]|nr:WSC domain-containing protein [Xylogone sp. PMI_703]
MASFRSAMAASAVMVLFAGTNASFLARRAPQPSCANFTPFVYAGCYQDPYNARALVFDTGLDSSSMTQETCIAFCKGNNYRYAGLEDGGECFCGSAINGPKLDDAECSTPCSGNPDEMCGGNLILSIYEDPTFQDVDPTDISDYVPLGCFSEGSSGSALAWQQTQVSAASLSVESCLAACKAGGFPIAGIQNGDCCFCGTVLGDGSAPVNSSECNIPCPGYGSQTCGGSNALNLYLAPDLEPSEPCTQRSVPGSSSTTYGYPPSTTTTTTTTTTTPCTTTTATSTSCTESSGSGAFSTTGSGTASTSPAKASTTTSCTESTTSSGASSTTTPCTTSTSVSRPSSSPCPESSTSATTTSCTSSSTSISTSRITYGNNTMTRTTSSYTAASLCSSTTVVAPPAATCEYQVGSWCSETIPDFNNGASCEDAADACNAQTSCFGEAGYPSSLQCFEFTNWCTSLSNYCNTTCATSYSCSKSDFLSSNPPSGPAPTPTSSAPSSTSTTTTTTPPPTTMTTTTTTTTTTTSTTTTTTTTQNPIPTCGSVCVQANNPLMGYSTGNPLGGICMPDVTCNNELSTYNEGYCYKMYISPNTSIDPAYTGGQLRDACWDACDAQYNACVNLWAMQCTGVEQMTRKMHCMSQKLDCHTQNSSPVDTGMCSVFGQC